MSDGGKRVYDDQGRIRCRVCETFKPISEMAKDSPSIRRPDGCLTICRSCKNRKRAAQNKANGIHRAIHRAERRLAAEQAERFAELLDEEIKRLDAEVQVGSKRIEYIEQGVYEFMEIANVG